MRMVIGGMIPGLSGMSVLSLSAPTWPRTTWPAAVLPPAVRVRHPTKAESAGRRSSTRLCTACARLIGRTAAPDRQLALGTWQRPRPCPEPSRAARPLSIRLPVTGGDLPKQRPAKREPRFRRLGSRATRRHKTRASHGHRLTGHGRGLHKRHGTPRACPR